MDSRHTLTRLQPQEATRKSRRRMSCRLNPRGTSLWMCVCFHTRLKKSSFVWTKHPIKPWWTRTHGRLRRRKTTSESAWWLTCAEIGSTFSASFCMKTSREDRSTISRAIQRELFQFNGLLTGCLMKSKMRLAGSCRYLVLAKSATTYPCLAKNHSLQPRLVHSSPVAECKLIGKMHWVNNSSKRK